MNSGVGIYAQDFKNWSYGSTINKDISTKSYNKFHIVKKKADNWFGFTIGIPKNNYYNQSYKLKFNINKKIDDIKFSIVSTDGNLITTGAYSVYINDGSIIDVPIIADKFLKMIEEEDGNVDIENLLGKVTDNLIVSGVKEYSGMSIGNGKIAIGIPGTDKSIVLEANDIETFKQSLVK